MVTLVGVALAAPWSALGALPDCSAAEGRQQVLLQGVSGLTFDDAGRLWVADGGSLTLRDPTDLSVIHEPVPGVNAWGSLADGTAWSSTGLKVRLDGGLSWGAPPFFRSEWMGPVKGAVAEPHPLDLRYWPARKRVSALDRTTGRRATADRDHLRVFEADGTLLAERAIVSRVDAVGLLQERLFTVDRGRLRIWSADGAEVVEVEGSWSSAVVREHDILATDLRGGVYSIAPETGAISARGCVFESCEEPVNTGGIPYPEPLETDTPDTYGPRILAWSTELLSVLEQPSVRPTAVYANTSHVVVAVLEPGPWERMGKHVIEALVVLDRKGGRVRGRLDVEVEEGVEPKLVGDGLVFGDRAWSLLHLKPVPVPAYPDGPDLQIIMKEGRNSEEVRIGEYREGAFKGAAGLPPRIVPQRRNTTVGGVFGERVVLGGRASLMGNSTEVWCRPEQGGPSRTNAPGLIASSHPVVGNDSQRPLLPEPPRRIVGDGVGGRYAGQEVLSDRSIVWTAEGIREIPSVPSGWEIVVHTNTPPPSGLPDGVRWTQQAVGSRASVQWVRRGIVLWAGPPEAMPNDVVFAEVEVEVSDAVARRWGRRYSVQKEGPETKTQGREGWVGRALPAVDWKWRPRSTTFVVRIGGEPDSVAWKIADELGVAIAVVVENEPARPPRVAIPWGFSEALTALPPRSLLYVEEGVILWTGADRRQLAEWLAERP